MDREDAIAEVVTPKYRRLLLLILLLGLLLRVGAHLDLRANEPGYNSPALDSQEFLLWAGRIASGDVLGDRPFFLNPLYPYFIAPILAVSGTFAIDAIRLVQGALGLLTVLLVAGSVRRLVGPREALLAALFAAAYPLLLFYEQTVMIVALATFLNSLALWLLARFADRRSLPSALLAGVAIGLSVLARPNVALFAVFLPLWFLTLVPRERRLRFTATATLAVFVGTVVVILPVTIRNFLVGKDLVFVTSSMGVNLWQSNNPHAADVGRMTSKELRLNPALIEGDAKKIAEREQGRDLKPSEVSTYWSRRTFAAIGDHPGRAVLFLGRKLFTFLKGFEVPSSYHFEAGREDLVLLRFIPLNFTILCPLALLGVFLSFRRAAGGIPFAWFFLAYAVGLTIFYPLSHYRAPVLPAAFALAAIGVLQLLREAAERRWTSLRWSVAALVVLFVAINATEILGSLGVSVGAGQPDNRVVYHYNRGLLFLGRGELTRAEKSFEEARKQDPKSHLADIGMAELARSRGEPANESRFLEAALGKLPGNPPILANYGRNLILRGHRKAGLERIEAAARAAPRDWTVQTAVADGYGLLGRFEDALRSYEIAEENGCPNMAVIADQGRCLRKLDRLEEALKRVERGLSVSPGSGPLHMERARINIQLGSADPDLIRRDVRIAREDGLRIPSDLQGWIDEDR